MKETILIIEDNADLRENTAEILEMAGYNTIIVNSGKEGLESASKHKPNLILCDIVMQELDGDDVLGALENLPEENKIPFVFVAARSEKSDLKKAMDLGVDDYITKPFIAEDLLRTVAERSKKTAFN